MSQKRLFCSLCIRDVPASLASHLQRDALNVVKCLGLSEVSISWAEHQHKNEPTYMAYKLLDSWCESFRQQNLSFDSDSFAQILGQALKEGGREDLVDNLKKHKCKCLES